MELGTLLVLLGIILAVVSVFITTHTHRILTASVILIGVGVLAGVGDLVV
jgi:cell division protein FtsL